MIKYILIFMFSVFISSVSQILLKISAGRSYSSLLAEYVNVRVIVAYVVFFASSLLTVLAYSKVPLSLGPVLESAGYIFVSLMGHFCLGERIGKRKIWGMIFISAGIAIACM
jgi:drug/metabolite transporter (DMT)-like permease